MKLKNPSSLLKDRRTMLGLSQQDVAANLGIEWGTYRQWECRGQIPEEHLSELARVFKVSEMDLLIAKYSPLIEDVFEIDKDTLELFLRRNSRR